VAARTCWEHVLNKALPDLEGKLKLSEATVSSFIMPEMLQAFKIENDRYLHLVEKSVSNGCFCLDLKNGGRY
jgi:hypothetical protein